MATRRFVFNDRVLVNKMQRGETLRIPLPRNKSQGEMHKPTPSLQDGVDKAGAPIRLLWKAKENASRTGILVDKAHAEPCTEVAAPGETTPGPGTPPETHADLPRIRTRVEASPYNEHARTEYRRN